MAVTFQQPFSKNKVDEIVIYKIQKQTQAKVTMETIHVQSTASIVLWIIIPVTPVRILFKMPSIIIYCHSQLKSLSWIDFSCVFNIALRLLIHNASAIFRFHLLLWKFLWTILKSMVLTFSYDFSILWFYTCDVWSLPLWSFILSVIWRALYPTLYYYLDLLDMVITIYVYSCCCFLLHWWYWMELAELVKLAWKLCQ